MYGVVVCVVRIRVFADGVAAVVDVYVDVVSFDCCGVVAVVGMCYVGVCGVVIVCFSTVIVSAVGVLLYVTFFVVHVDTRDNNNNNINNNIVKYNTTI